VGHHFTWQEVAKDCGTDIFRLKKVWIVLFSLCLYGVIRDCFDLNIASIVIRSKIPRYNSSQSEKKAELISVFPRLTPVTRSCFAV